MMKKKNLVIILSIVGLVLLLPLISMQFTNEVNWSFGDFVIAAILLFVIGISLLAVWQRIKDRKQRIFISLGVLLLFLLVWAELAVGIFNTPFAGN